MCNPALAIAGVQLAAGGVQAYTQYQQGIGTSKYYSALAEQSRQEGQAALARGDKQSELIGDSAKQEVSQFKKEGAQLTARQKAALVASGVPLSSVTAADIATSTMRELNLDEAAIRYNAALKEYETKEEARYTNWQAQNQASIYGSSAKNAKKAANIGLFSTLLGTAASVGLSGFQTGLFSSKTVTPGLGNYWSNTPVGTQNMGTWSKLPKGYFK